MEAWSTGLESTLWKGGHEHFAKVPVKRELGSSGIGILIWDNIGKTSGSYWDLESIRLGNLITAIFITRHRTGPLGKGAVIEAYAQGFKLPCAVDDNKVIQDCANRQVHTAHTKVRRKPWTQPSHWRDSLRGIVEGWKDGTSASEPGWGSCIYARFTGEPNENIGI